MATDKLFQQCDFHIHTCLSECARPNMRLPDILTVCAQRGIDYLGITDHVFPSTNPDILKTAGDELAALDKPMNVFLGCEADVVEVGEHTVTDEMRSTLDFIMVAANHYQLPWISQPPDMSASSVAGHILDMFTYACSLSFADVIAHPMCEVSGKYDPTCLNLLSDDELTHALKVAKRNNVAMEISPRALLPEDRRFRLRFYSLCKKAGLKFAFGTDAHSLNHAGQTWVLKGLVNELGIVDGDVWLPNAATTT